MQYFAKGLFLGSLQRPCIAGLASDWENAIMITTKSCNHANQQCIRDTERRGLCRLALRPFCAWLGARLQKV